MSILPLSKKTLTPILQDLNSEGGRLDLGIDDSEGVLARAHFYPFRLLPGDDTSCLNLYQPQRPRVLGVPGDFRSRGGFEFQQLVDDLSPREKDSPWSILERNMGPDVVPAFGDYESVRWILKLGLGKDLVIADETGRPVRLRLVGLLHASIFQSEILISEAAFNRLFPSRAGVKARQAGLLPNAVLYKPFRLDQLLSTVDAVVEAANSMQQT